VTKDFPLLVTFNDSSFIIQNKITRTVVAIGICDDSLYILKRGNTAFISVLNKSVLTASYDLWHARLGHVNHSIISLLNKKGHLSLTFILPNPVICATCQIAKSHKLPFSTNNTRSNSILGLIHCDIRGPAPIKSKMSFAYYVIFIDDHSRFTWLYPMKFKSYFIDIFLQYQIFVENQYSCKIKISQSDGGAEFCSNCFQSQLHSSGIQHQKSCPYTPSQNGRAERTHRHVTEMGLALLFHSRVPTYYWVDAFSTATCIINRLPTQLLGGLSPFEILHGKAPLYINFHPFGCRVYPCLRDYAANKFSPRSIPCIFLGYSPSYKGYRCLNPLTSKIYVTPHAKFDELNFPLIPNSIAQSPASLDLSSFSEPMQAHDPPLSTTPLSTVPLSNPHSRSRSHACRLCSDSLLEPMQVSTYQMSSTQHTPASSEAPDPPTQAPLHSEAPAHHHDQSAASSSHPMVTQAKAGIFRPRYPTYLSQHVSGLLHALLTTSEPRGFKTAAKNPAWLAAMDEELNALRKNCTWDFVPRPPKTNIVGSKWVFRMKYQSDGSIDRLKARLVAKGYTQLPGLDYTDTFSPVVKASTVHVVLSLAITHGWPLRQLDVKNVFLHGILQEHVYMEQPPGYVDPHFPQHVCKLKKALYGLKQAPRAWFQRFSSFLLKLGFTCSCANTSLFVLHRQQQIIYLLLYVDDIILTGNNNSLLSSFIRQLHLEFATKD